MDAELLSSMQAVRHMTASRLAIPATSTKEDPKRPGATTATLCSVTSTIGAATLNDARLAVAN